ncbi:MAG: DinB family protein [Phycisphaerales bacterium]
MTERAAYHARMAALVGTRDHFAVLETTPSRLHHLALTYPAVVWRTQPFPSKWAPREIVTHLVDHEVVMAYRLRRVILEGAARIDGYPQERWIACRGEDGRSLSRLLETFESLRADTLSLWRILPEGRLDDPVTRSDGALETLSLLRMTHAGHDLAHLEQLERYLNAAHGEQS